MRSKLQHPPFSEDAPVPDFCIAVLSFMIFLMRGNQNPNWKWPK
jgi:hypothetical protein